MPISINITDIDNLSDRERRVLSAIAVITPSVAEAFVKAAQEVGASSPINTLAGPVTHPQGTVAVALPDTAIAAADPDDNGEAGVLAAEERTHDNRGIPHDSRVHSNPPSITASGQWRAKRGVDKDLLRKIEGEYLQAVQAAKEAKNAEYGPLGYTPGNAAPAADAAAPSGFALLAAAQAASAVPPAPPAAVPPVPPAPAALGTSPVPAVGAPAVIDPSGIGALLRKVGEATTSGKLTQQDVQAVCVALGIAHLGALMATPERIPEAHAALQAYGV